MEQFEELINKAKSYSHMAQRGLKFTYPLVKENKVLLGVVQHLFLACTNAMGAALAFEHYHKRIVSYEDNFEAKFRLIRTKLEERYHFEEDQLRMIRDLKDIIIAHQESPIEFSRGDTYIICQDNYELKEISAKSLEVALQKTNLFIDNVSHVISRC